METNNRQPRLPLIPHASLLSPLRPSSAPCHCLTAFLHGKPWFCYCWGPPKSSYGSVPCRTFSEDLAASDPLWRQEAHSSPPLHLHRHWDHCLADFIHLAAHSPNGDSGRPPKKLSTIDRPTLHVLYIFLTSTVWHMKMIHSSHIVILTCISFLYACTLWCRLILFYRFRERCSRSSLRRTVTIH
jgi:hypothetical protein